MTSGEESKLGRSDCLQQGSQAVRISRDRGGLNLTRHHSNVPNCCRLTRLSSSSFHNRKPFSHNGKCVMEDTAPLSISLVFVGQYYSK